MTPRGWLSARQIDGPAEVLLGRRGVSKPLVERALVVQRFDQLARQLRVLVYLQSGVVGVDGGGIFALPRQRPGLALEPVGLLFLEARLAGQLQGAIEIVDGLLNLPESLVAQRQVAEVLAGRRLELQSLADGQRLLVVAERLAALAEQQVDAADVPKVVAPAPSNFVPRSI